ncbi:MAG: hypothetical protein IH991_21730 [Planctomycetes bacterium]|nr:hypothetical protein [Planctomycetota bacterium]
MNKAIPAGEHEIKEKAFFAVLLVIVTFGLCNSASATLVGVAEASKVDA